MKTQELDPFAIKSYTFALGKTNNFFSFTTVILSICVVGLSIGLSYETISHLWVPLKELPTLISKAQQHPGPLSSTLVCFNLTEFNGSTPTYRLWNSKFEFINYPYVTQEEALKKYPNLTQVIGSKFGCINLKGLSFSQQMSAIFMQVQVPSAFYYVETATVQSIINGQPNNFTRTPLIRTPNVPSSKNITSYGNSIRVWGLNANIYNSLYPNDEGQQYRYFTSLIFRSHQVVSPIISNCSVFSIFSYSTSTITQKIQTTSLTITRYDFSFILGAVLSWISIFGLICGFIVGPLMQKALNLIQAETLFYLPQSDRKPSVFKFMVSSFKKGIFPKEDKYCKLVDELQKLKNVSCSLKVQKTLRRLCPRSSKLSQNQVIAAEHNFDEPESNSFEIETYSEGGKYSAADFNVEQDQKSENLITKARKGIFHWLDMGSDVVSINYSGKGHGSKESVCVSFIFIVSFIAFLALFGVFKFSKQQLKYNKRSVDDISYTHVAKQIIVGNWGGNVKFFITDGYGNTIRQLNSTSGNECLTYATTPIKNIIIPYIANGKTAVFNCPTQDYQLVGSNDPLTVRTLRIDNSVAKDPYGTFHLQTDTTSKVADMIWFTSIWSCGTSYREALVTIINVIEDGNNIFTGSQLELSQQLTDISRRKCGFYIRLNQNQIIQQTINTDFFTMIQNVWGLTTIAFTLLLMKLTKYINLRQKQKVVTPEKSEFRDNLCIFLSKINGLLAGRHKGQLEKAKYYLKEPMPRPRR